MLFWFWFWFCAVVVSGGGRGEEEGSLVGDVVGRGRFLEAFLCVVWPLVVQEVQAGQCLVDSVVRPVLYLFFSFFCFPFFFNT